MAILGYVQPISISLQIKFINVLGHGIPIDLLFYCWGQGLGGCQLLDVGGFVASTPTSRLFSRVLFVLGRGSRFRSISHFLLLHVGFFSQLSLSRMVRQLTLMKHQARCPFYWFGKGDSIFSNVLVVY